jgi:adenylylsulfate kinase-like enzyme
MASTKIRVVTAVYNEETFLPHFLRHYEAFADSIVVWDNGSSDRTRELVASHPLVELRTFETDGFDEEACVRVLEETRRESEGAYDWCVIADCDEFLVGRGIPVRTVIERAEAEILVPFGYCLVEAPWDIGLDLSREIIPQRRFGVRSPAYSKPVIMRPSAKARLGPGKHHVDLEGPCRMARAPSLALVHLDMVDRRLWEYRKNRRKLNPESAAKGHNVGRFCLSREELGIMWDRAASGISDISALLATPPIERKDGGGIVWITGRQASGKSTLAILAAAAVHALGGRAKILDDNVLSHALYDGPADERHVRDYAVERMWFLARHVARNGMVAVVAMNSPYWIGREEVRHAAIHDGAPFVEIRVGRSGETPGYYEEPQMPEAVVNAESTSPEELAGIVRRWIALPGHPSGAR